MASHHIDLEKTLLQLFLPSLAKPFYKAALSPKRFVCFARSAAGIIEVVLRLGECLHSAWKVYSQNDTNYSKTRRKWKLRAIVSVLEMPGQKVLADSEMVEHFYIWSDTIQTNYVVKSIYQKCRFCVCMCVYIF